MITDRAQADVDYALALRGKLMWGESLSSEEQADYMAGLKGAYNVSDLNRVEGKVLELKNRLSETGYIVPNMTIKTDWQRGEFLKRADFERYLGNIDVLRDAYFVKPNTPNTPQVDDWINYMAANNIEQVLVDIEKVLNEMIASHLYCGDTIGVV